MDSAPHPPNRDDFGFPGLLIVTLIIMIFMVGVISLLAVTGAAWALWLAFAVMLVSCAVLMASMAAMFNEPDERASVPETPDENRAERSHEERTGAAPTRSTRPDARPVAHGGY
jgi:membrane protein implicated in regulation of membrane protease activity